MEPFREPEPGKGGACLNYACKAGRGGADEDEPGRIRRVTQRLRKKRKLLLKGDNQEQKMRPGRQGMDLNLKRRTGGHNWGVPGKNRKVKLSIQKQSHRPREGRT